jgi:hypothetical protein
MKPCPVLNCNESRKDSQLACSFHWFALPKNLRDRVWKGYRTAKGGPEHMQAVSEAMRLLKKMDLTS